MITSGSACEKQNKNKTNERFLVPSVDLVRCNSQRPRPDNPLRLPRVSGDSAHQANVGSLAVEQLSHLCTSTPILITSVKGKKKNVYLGENGYKMWQSHTTECYVAVTMDNLQLHASTLIHIRNIM